MLGLSSGLIYPNYLGGINQPSDVSNLLGWWDFTDASSMYTDAGSTNVSSDEDKIYRIDNKAYTQAGNEAIGQFLQQTTEDDRPLFYTSGGTNSKSHAFFYQESGSESMYLFAHASVGNTVSGKLSTATYDNDTQTIFFVYHTTTRYPGRMTLFGLYGHDYDAGSGFYDKYKSSGELQYRVIQRSDTDGDGDTDNDDEYRPELYMRRGILNGSTGPTYRQWDPVGLGIGLEATSVKFRYDTAIVDGQTATTTSAPYLRPGRLLRNGDNSNGINSSFKTSVSNSNDNTDTSLNLGVDGTISPFSVQVGAFLNTIGGSIFSTYASPSTEFLAATRVYEIIYYNKVLNQEEITGVQNYIENKYGEPPY
jgi:hypothetical protein